MGGTGALAALSRRHPGRWPVAPGRQSPLMANTAPPHPRPSLCVPVVIWHWCVHSLWECTALPERPEGPSAPQPPAGSRVGETECPALPHLASWRGIWALVTARRPHKLGKEPLGLAFCGCWVLPHVNSGHSEVLGGQDGPTLAGKAARDSRPSPALPAGQLLPHPNPSS